MRFEWRQEKERANIAARGIDFVFLQALFDGRPVFTYPSARHDEERWVTVGAIGEKYYAVVWTRRGENIRIISGRRARDAEERRYRELHGG